jgi:hypothetical protein
MGVVYHHDCAVFFCKRCELIDRADVTVHGEDSVSDQEPVAGLVLNFFEQLFGVSDVFVAEDFDLGFGETSAVDDAGVVELVREDEVVFTEDAGDGAGVGGEAGLKDDTGLDAFECGDLLFEFHVDVHRAGDGADGAGAYAEFFGGGDGGLFEFGVIAEAEVVVGGEVDDALAVIGTDGGLLVVEFAQFEEGSPLAEVVELGSEMSELGAFGGCGSHGINRKPLGAGWF